MTTTLMPLIDMYIAERRRLPGFSKGTERHTRRALYSLDGRFGRRPLPKLTPRAVETWLGSLGGLSDSTRRLYRQDARTFCQWLLRDGRLGSNPVDQVARIPKPRRLPRALTAAQVGRLLAVAPDVRAVAIIHLMVDLGLRCCEVAGLRMVDYDPAGATVLVRGKGGHERQLPVLEATTTALQRYFTIRETGGGALISSYSRPGAHLTALYVSTVLSRWARQAGIKTHRFDGVSAHALRHTCASDVLERSGNLQAVQEMLGHADLATTSIYLRRVAAGRLREAMEGRDYQASA